MPNPDGYLFTSNVFNFFIYKSFVWNKVGIRNLGYRSKKLNIGWRYVSYMEILVEAKLIRSVISPGKIRKPLQTFRLWVKSLICQNIETKTKNQKFINIWFVFFRRSSLIQAYSQFSMWQRSYCKLSIGPVLAEQAKHQISQLA